MTTNQLSSNRHRTSSRGFTLPEILVAIAIMALLAAVLLPTVAGQIFKGDASKVASDLQAVRSGSEQFLADVHRFPGKYSDLTTAITTLNTDILGNAYRAGLVSRWKGPYVNADTTGSGFATGFGGAINNPFMLVTNTNGVQYLTVVVTGINGPDFDKVNTLIYGPSATRTTGLLRWVSTGGIDSTKFLAIAIQ